MTKITCKADMLRRPFTITQSEDEPMVWEVECNGFLPEAVEADNPGEALMKAMSVVGRMRKNPDYVSTRKPNPNAFGRGAKAAMGGQSAAMETPIAPPVPGPNMPASVKADDKKKGQAKPSAA